jgi:peptidase E
MSFVPPNLFAGGCREFMLQCIEVRQTNNQMLRSIAYLPKAAFTAASRQYVAPKRAVVTRLYSLSKISASEKGSYRC